MIGFFETFLHEYMVLSLSLVALLGSIFCYLRVPLFGKEVAIVLFGLSAGLAAYSQGYAERADEDHSAELQARINDLNADIASAHRAAADASVRAVSLDAARSAAEDRVSQYEQYLAKQQASNQQAKQPVTVVVESPGKPVPAPRPADTCSLGADDLGWLRPTAGSKPGHKPKSAAHP